MSFTNEQIEARLKQTADTVETAVGDMRKNLATKKEVLDLINERTGIDGELIKSSAADIDRLNTGADEVKANLDRLDEEIRKFKNQRLASAAMQGSNRNYKGYFSSPQEAKTFALLVMAAATSGHSQLSERHEAASKALDAMGIEPYWLDGSGHKAMTGSSQAAGSALVTIEQIPTIIMLLERYSKFRANAQIVPMGAGSTTQPKVDSLLEITCPGEGKEATLKDPTIAILSMLPKTLIAVTAYSIELEDDSLVLLGELLIGLFTRSFAYYEDLFGFLGDGTSTYFGFKGCVGALRAVDATIANIKSLVVGAGNAYSELTLANFKSVVGVAP